MITYPLNDTLEQNIVNLVVDLESEPIGCPRHTVPVAHVQLADGRLGQVQLIITTDDDDFIEDESIPNIDFLITG